MADTHTYYATSKGYNIEFFSVIYGGTPVSFPAMVTNFQNSFAPSWNSETVFGRMDPIITYTNTPRTINMSFTVAAASKAAAQTNLDSLNRLITFLYPAYRERGTANSISASPLFRIKFANLIYDASRDPNGSAEDSGLVCGINSFDHSFSFDGKYNWIDRQSNLVPMAFDVSFGAIVLHTHDVGRVNGVFGGRAMEFPYNRRGSTAAAAPNDARQHIDDAGGAAVTVAESGPTNQSAPVDTTEITEGTA